jgi:hypothetical protein
MLLREYLDKNQVGSDEVILLKHSGAKESFCCRPVSKLTVYELNLEVLEQLPTDNIECSLFSQDKLNRCSLYLIVCSIRDIHYIELMRKASIENARRKRVLC